MKVLSYYSAEQGHPTFFFARGHNHYYGLLQGPYLNHSKWNT